MKSKKLIINNPDVAIKLTKEQFKVFNIDTSKDTHLNTEHSGVWQQIAKCSGLCMSATWDKSSMFARKTEAVIYGNRTMSDIRSGGYELEGRVSIDGKKYTCFTSSQLFDTPEGKTIEVGIIHARVR